MSQNFHRGTPRRGRGGRGGSRGSRFDNNSNLGGRRFGGPAGDIPNARQVVSGAGVSIVLKVDQPTGNEVQGIVETVLGRGDHPRGIKVRLEDGRVGRVQRMVNEAIARDAAAGSSNLGRNGESNTSTTGFSSRPTIHTGSQYSDLRNDPYDYTSASASRDPISLEDYIKPSKNRKKNRNTINTDENAEGSEELTPSNPTTTATLITCPVCGLFQGDEEAVAFHANNHFD